MGVRRAEKDDHLDGFALGIYDIPSPQAVPVVGVAIRLRGRAGQTSE